MWKSTTTLAWIWRFTQKEYFFGIDFWKFYSSTIFYTSWSRDKFHVCICPKDYKTRSMNGVCWIEFDLIMFFIQTADKGHTLHKCLARISHVMKILIWVPVICHVKRYKVKVLKKFSIERLVTLLTSMHMIIFYL